MTTITTSPKFGLNANDFIKGLIVAVISPVFTILITSLEKGDWVINWKAIGSFALAALLAYLVKNFLDPAKIVISDPAPATIADVKKGNAKVTITNPH